MKDIQGYEGLYAVTEDGRVWSHRSQKFLKFGRSREYLQVCLHKDGKGKQLMVHRLVALAYIENPECKQTVNHIDGNHHNNDVSNLEWMTMQENNQAAWDNGQRVITEKMREQMEKNLAKGRIIKFTEEKIAQVRKLHKMTFSNRAIAKMFNTSHSVIGKILAKPSGC